LILIKGGFSQDFYREFHCEGQVLTLSCQSGYFINIYSAFYGRFDQRICGSPYHIGFERTGCKSDVKEKFDSCLGLTTCQIKVGNGWTDPCPGIGKYSEVLYTCDTL